MQKDVAFIKDVNPVLIGVSFGDFSARNIKTHQSEKTDNYL